MLYPVQQLIFFLFVIIIIIIIILGFSFMQGIYTHIPETNHVPREHCVATILM
jgi:CHASE3 domain sensor protein